MKRKKTNEYIEIIISDGSSRCHKCHHQRKGEPFAIFYVCTNQGDMPRDAICWRCCRDAESTLLIKQKWPLAFDRVQLTYGFVLEWAPGVRELVGEHEKA